MFIMSSDETISVSADDGDECVSVTVSHHVASSSSATASVAAALHNEHLDSLSRSHTHTRSVRVCPLEGLHCEK